MKKPKREEVIAYFKDHHGKDKEMADSFYDYYESVGWKVGKKPMVSWTHAVGNWVRNSKKFEPQWKQEQKKQQEQYRQVYRNDNKDYGKIDYEAFKQRIGKPDKRSRMGFADEQYLNFRRQYLNQRGQGESHTEHPADED